MVKLLAEKQTSRLSLIESASDDRAVRVSSNAESFMERTVIAGYLEGNIGAFSSTDCARFCREVGPGNQCVVGTRA
jgi:hypothetical protein